MQQPRKNPFVAVLNGVGIDFFRIDVVFYAYASQYVACSMENLVSHDFVVIRGSVEFLAVNHSVARGKKKSYHAERLIFDVPCNKVEKPVFLCDGVQVVTAAYHYLYAVLEYVDRKCLAFVHISFLFIRIYSTPLRKLGENHPFGG